jgi:hypothetical protein
MVFRRGGKEKFYKECQTDNWLKTNCRKTCKLCGPTETTTKAQTAPTKTRTPTEPPTTHEPTEQPTTTKKTNSPTEPPTTTGARCMDLSNSCFEEKALLRDRFYTTCQTDEWLIKFCQKTCHHCGPTTAPKEEESTATTPITTQPTEECADLSRSCFEEAVSEQSLLFKTGAA